MVGISIFEFVSYFDFRISFSGIRLDFLLPFTTIVYDYARDRDIL